MINFEENDNFICKECGWKFPELLPIEDEEGKIIYCEVCGKPNFIKYQKINGNSAPMQQTQFKSIWNIHSGNSRNNFEG